MSDSDEPIHGSIEEVIKQLTQEVANGTMSPEQMAELIGVLVDQGKHSHNVTIPFRVAMIAQGREDIAHMVDQVTMTLTDAGAMFAYGVEAKHQAEFDAFNPLLNRIFRQASVWILRAGNIDASLDDDNPARIAINGLIHDDDEQPDIEAMVKDFVAELDEVFPSAPPPRKGDWW